MIKKKSNPNKIKTNIDSFDNTTGGLALGQLITIAGRPSMGKTSFAITLIVNLGILQQIPIAFLSLEMSNAQIVRRIIKTMEIDESELQSIMGKTDIQENYSEGLNKLLDAPVYLDDTPVLSIEEIDEKITAISSSNSVKVIFIDYLQLIKDFQLHPIKIAKQLKDIAAKTGVCIIVLSQIYNKFNHHGPIEVNNTFFREGTEAIMNHSDTVILLYRPSYYHYDRDSKLFDIAEMKFLKSRHNQNEVIELSFLYEYAKFTTWNSSKIESQVSE